MFQITIEALLLKAFLLVFILYVVTCIEQAGPVQFVDVDSSEKRILNLEEVLKENKKYSQFPELCPSTRIHGGKSVSISKVPYQVALRRKGFMNFNSHLFCGGSLITLKHVVTAAHCFVNSNYDVTQLSNVRVVAGTEIASGTIFSINKEHSRPIKHFFGHQYYNNILLWNDIGIIEVEGQFVISSSIKPIRMHTNDLDVNLNEHVKCLVSGFGQTESNEFTTNLRMVCVPIIKRSVCRSFYSRGLIHEDVLCAGTYGKDSCQVLVILEVQSFARVSWSAWSRLVLCVAEVQAYTHDCQVILNMMVYLLVNLIDSG